MRKILTLGTILLGCCLAVVAQTNYSDQGSSESDQAQPSQAQPGQAQPGDMEQAQPSEQPGQSQAPEATEPSTEQSNSALQSENQKTTIQGCLTQSPEGNFMLADAAGNAYQLNDSAQRLGQFVGQEIRVSGFESAAGEGNPGAMSEAPPSSPQLQGQIQQINVSKVHKVADTCQSSPSKQP